MTLAGLLDQGPKLMQLIIGIGFVVVIAKLLREVSFRELVMSKGDNLPSTSRFQMLFWTTVYGCAFIYKFLANGEIPSFDMAQVSVLLLGGGVYLGAKALGSNGLLNRPSGGANSTPVAGPPGPAR